MLGIIIGTAAVYAVILILVWFLSREIEIRRITRLPDTWDFERHKQEEHDIIWYCEG